MPPSGVRIDIDPGALAAANQRILGSKMGTTTVATDIPRLIQYYEAGRLRLDELISGRFPLGEINAAIDQVRSGHAVRNVIVFEDTASEGNGLR
jgi:Zn-dependent alcohol dehydrogenase